MAEITPTKFSLFFSLGGIILPFCQEFVMRWGVRGIRDFLVVQHSPQDMDNQAELIGGATRLC